MKTKFFLLVVLAVVGGTSTGLVAAYHWGSPAIPVSRLEQELFAGSKRRSQQRQQEGVPRVRVEGARYDFGEQDEPFGGSHMLVIHNEGKGPLRITIRKIEGDCRVRRMSARPFIPPGEYETVMVFWRPPPRPGKVTVRLELRTNDPQRPKIPVLITGRVSGLIRAKPYSLSFRLRSGQTASQTVKILALGFRQLPLAKVRVAGSSAKPCFRARLLPSREDLFAEEEGLVARVREVQVEVVPMNVPGIYTAHLEVFLPDKKQPVVTIPLKLEVLGTFRLVGVPRGRTDNRFRLGRIPRRQGKTFHLTVIGYGQASGKARLQVQEVYPRFLQVEVGAAEKIPNKENRWRWPLKIQIPPGSPVGRFPENPSGPGGKIVLKTGHAGQPVLEIPVSFTIVP